MMQSLAHHTPRGFLSSHGFEHACEQLCAAAETSSTEPFRLRLCHQAGAVHLKIERAVASLRTAALVEQATNAHVDAADGIEEVLEDEDEVWSHYSLVGELSSRRKAAVRCPGDEKRSCAVVYNVLLSPTYGVPVLYFAFADLPENGPQGLEAVYAYLVPSTSASQLQQVGVMGGVTMTNHPLTGTPCFFVHPCNTAEAMCQIVGSGPVSNLHYLQMWIGLIGASVGLYLPKELAVQCSVHSGTNVADKHRTEQEPQAQQKAEPGSIIYTPPEHLFISRAPAQPPCGCPETTGSQSV